MLPRTPTISLDGLRTSSRLLSEAHNARTMCWKPISFTHCRPVVHRTQRRVAQHLQGVAQNAPAAVVLRKTPSNHGSTTRGKACHITSNKRCLIHVEGGHRRPELSCPPILIETGRGRSRQLKGQGGVGPPCIYAFGIGASRGLRTTLQTAQESRLLLRNPGHPIRDAIGHRCSTCGGPPQRWRLHACCEQRLLSSNVG